LVLQQWPNQNGHYPTIAYQVAFGVNLSLQVAAFAWFELSVPVSRRLFRQFAPLAINKRSTHTDASR
jgi:hypothetical protein